MFLIIFQHIFERIRVNHSDLKLELLLKNIKMCLILRRIKQGSILQAQQVL